MKQALETGAKQQYHPVIPNPFTLATAVAVRNLLRENRAPGRFLIANPQATAPGFGMTNVFPGSTKK